MNQELLVTGFLNEVTAELHKLALVSLEAELLVVDREAGEEELVGRVAALPQVLLRWR